MLHGDIQVNNHTIGSWRAVHVDGGMDYDSIATYNVKAAYTNMSGYHQVAEWEIEHQYGHGALALATSVLTEMSKHLHAPQGSDSVGLALFAAAKQS